jgi:RNA polymerase sigma-70 factor (ECF subfamily)
MTQALLVVPALDGARRLGDPRGKRPRSRARSPLTSDPSELTRLFERAEAGDARAGEALLPVLYEELHGLAQRMMAEERTGHTLQATALVHEAWMRLFAGGSPTLNDRRHLTRLAARAMRRVLVDHARARGRVKRGGAAPRAELLDTLVAEVEGDGRLDVVALHEALERLAEFDALAARLVELRYFTGLSIAEAAGALEVSTPTVERRWRVARLWLARELGGATDAAAGEA